MAILEASVDPQTDIDDPITRQPDYDERIGDPDAESDLEEVPGEEENEEEEDDMEDEFVGSRRDS